MSTCFRTCVGSTPRVGGVPSATASFKRGTYLHSTHPLPFKGRRGAALRCSASRQVVAGAGVADATAQKRALYDALDKVSPNGLSATPDDQRNIAEMVAALEQANPTSEPARSPLMAGFWRMLYTDMEPAPSSGKLGPFVGDVFQDLRPSDSLILNLLKVGFPPIRGGLSAAQEVISPDTWRITFADVQQYLGPFKLQMKEFDQAKPEVRLWKITYLDEDLRILRAKREGEPPADAKGGKDDTGHPLSFEEFIFVLRREESERFALGE